MKIDFLKSTEWLTVAIVILTITACTTTQTSQSFTAILANPERPSEERALDAARKPDEVLKFYGVKAGDKVADIWAGRGYYTAILAQVVGPKGVVYSANPSARPELAERWKKPGFTNIKAIDGPSGSGSVAARCIARLRDHPPQLSRPLS